MANPRRLAALALLKVSGEGAYSNLILNNLFQGSDLKGEDKSLAAAIFYGVLDRRITLDFILNSLMKTPFKKTAPYTAEVLRCGLYQILYMDKIPNSAAVDEAVKLIKKSAENRNAGFVNAVLRNAARQEINLPTGDNARELSVYYSCPEWIVSSFLSDYGIEDTRKLLEESLKPADTIIRLNTVRDTRENIAKKLENLKISFDECQIPNALILKRGIDIQNNVLYKEGYFHVQDLASQTVIERLNPKKGERILDLCAAPGGKSFTAAEYMENTGEIVACDLHSQRVGLIEKGAKRLGLENISAVLNDATRFKEELGEFDAVLCDVPCSGFGVLGRKPDIKYKPPSDFVSLEEIQQKILENASGYVKKGGRLLYSTCTLRKAENENNLSKFLEKNNDFKLLYEHTYMPHKDKTDGFYCALLLKSH